MDGRPWELHAWYDGLNGQKINPATRAGLLAAALATSDKEKARGEYVELVAPRSGRSEFETKGIAPTLERMDKLGLVSIPLTELAYTPSYSFLLGFNLRLARPYLSQDDDPFYVIDNPVRKDKVFKVPYVAPASWKGSLRSAAVSIVVSSWRKNEQGVRGDPGELARERFRLTLLFGDEKGEEPDRTKDLARYLDELSSEAADIYRNLTRKYFGPDSATVLPHHAGRLYFYPTFFDRIGVEIINPHARDRRVGKNPIQIESVPVGGRGRFSLLYVPFGPMEQTEETRRAGVAQDLPLVARAVRAMLTTYGFGAKTSSGYGVAEEKLPEPGCLVIRLPGCRAAAPPGAARPPEPPETCRPFLEAGEDFSLKPKEWRKKHGETAVNMKRYAEARDAYRKYEEELRSHQEAASTPPEPSPRQPALWERTFRDFDELVEAAEAFGREEDISGGRR